MAKAESTGLNARIRALNDHWRRRSPVRRRGVKDWVCGGVTCESKYESAPVRVLWLLRDTNKALKEDSLPVLLRYLVKKEP